MQRGHLRLVTCPLARSRGGPLRVLVAENHPRVRDRLASVVSGAPGFDVAPERVDGTALRARIRRWDPDVLFMAIQLGCRSDIELLTELCDFGPGTPIVVLTMQRSTALAQRAVDHGAAGVVLKDHADSELIPAARAVAIGQPYVSPTITGRELGRPSSMSRFSQPADGGPTKMLPTSAEYAQPPLSLCRAPTR